ncbi:MAG TPA: HTTM domain-containing protein [Aggregicoccus sp.]|nr:HTTM domain-containing protein [Aggregicoccus sp.]
MSPPSLLAARNPLKVSGTLLPPNLLLAAKLLALVFILKHNPGKFPEPFLAFVPALEQLGSPQLFQTALQLVFWAAVPFLFFNWHVRAACLVIGADILLSVLASRANYSNNLTYTALFFILTGLYDPRVGRTLIRYQLALVYFGATLNKVLEPDWRSGAFVQAWLPHYLDVYPWIAAKLPGNLLSAVLGWLGILTELALVPLLLIKRLVPAALVLGAAYHTGLVVLTWGSTFNMFWPATLATFLALMEWPASVTVRYAPSSRWQQGARRLLAPLDLEGRYTWLEQQAGRLETEQGPGRVHTGAPALAQLLLYSPVVYFGFALLTWRVPKSIPLLLLLLAVVVYGAVQRGWGPWRSRLPPLVPRRST